MLLKRLPAGVVSICVCICVDILALVNKFGRSAGLMPLMAAEAGREKGASLPTQSITLVIHQATAARVY